MREPLSEGSARADAVREAAARILRVRHGRLTDAERQDVAQDVVAEFLHKERRLAEAGEPPIDNPEAWATRAAQHRAIDRHRWHDRHPETGPLEGPEEDGGVGVAARQAHALERFLIEGGRSPSMQALRGAQVDVILAALDDGQRRLLALVAEGRSYAEIADALGLASAAAVGGRLHRLRELAREVSLRAGYDVPWEEHPRPYA